MRVSFYTFEGRAEALFVFGSGLCFQPGKREKDGGFGGSVVSDCGEGLVGKAVVEEFVAGLVASLNLEE